MPDAPRFIVDAPLSASCSVRLNPGESRHAVAVLRLRPGACIVVFDGEGRFAGARITNIDKTFVEAAVDTVETEPALKPTLVVATAIPKGKRWQALIEKCTELGADRIAPVLAERGVARGEGDPARWRGWAVAAAKQSRRSRLPRIDEPARLPDFLAAASGGDALLLIADAEGDGYRFFHDRLRTASTVVALVGPEGGFTENEMNLAEMAGAKRLRLAPYTLRVETAAVAACSLIRQAVDGATGKGDKG